MSRRLVAVALILVAAVAAAQDGGKPDVYAIDRPFVVDLDGEKIPMPPAVIMPMPAFNALDAEVRALQKRPEACPGSISPAVWVFLGAVLGASAVAVVAFVR